MAANKKRGQLSGFRVIFQAKEMIFRTLFQLEQKTLLPKTPWAYNARQF